MERNAKPGEYVKILNNTISTWYSFYNLKRCLQVMRINEKQQMYLLNFEGVGCKVPFSDAEKVDVVFSETDGYFIEKCSN